MDSELEAKSGQSDREKSSDVFLPPGLTLQKIRQILPSSAQLTAQFTSDRSGRLPIRFQVDDAVFTLFTGVKYVVGVNPTDAEVYLNPLESSEDVPEESNIPQALDDFLSQEGTRKQLQNLRIVLESSEVDLNETLERINDNEFYNQTVRECKKRWEEIGEEELSARLEGYLKKVGLADIERGSNCGQLLLNTLEVYLDYYYYFAKAKDPSLTVDQMLDRMMDAGLGRIKEIIDTRVPQLENLSSDPNEMVIALDTCKFEPGYEDLTETVVTTYIPRRGWSCALPTGACPNQVKPRMLDLLSGELNEEEFPTFADSAKRLIESGQLIIDRENNLLRFKKLNSLRIDRAVFHGDDPIEYALETFRTMGDPFLGEMHFLMILFKHSEIPEVDEGAPIIISSKEITHES